MSYKVRVIAGKYRHRQLVQPLNITTRVTKDRVKEAVFSALGNAIENSDVLDLFSGIGSYGIEALSRGAKKAIFNDNNPEMYTIIKQNTKFVNEPIAIYDELHTSLLQKLEENSVDIIFLDPPYTEDVQAIALEVVTSGILTKQSIIVCETNKQYNFAKIKGKIKHYKYGKTFITIVWRGE